MKPTIRFTDTPAPPDRYVDFIIGVDENGNEITHTCELKEVFYPTIGISNNPIFVDFDKRVLDKYRQDTETYTLWPMSLVCDYQWNMPIDSYHEDKVTVLLGYLSRVPYEEQLHWRAHNIPPNGRENGAYGVSEEYYRLYIWDGRYRDGNLDKAKHRFREAYYELRATCYERLGWQLLLPPHPDEEHYIADLTLPAPDELRDFDALVSSLCTLCIDALNIPELKKLVPVEQRRTLEGKDTLACFLDILYYRQVPIAHYGYFLRELHRLRHRCAAYRKACNYRQIANDFGYDNRSHRAVFVGLLGQAVRIVSRYASLVRHLDISAETLEERRARIASGYEKGVAAFAKMAELAATLPPGPATDGSINHDVVPDDF